jgi:rhodanese-related sulfurtransferase
MHTITAAELHPHLTQRTTLDVRSAAEFAIDHIPGSINIPIEQIESRMIDIPVAPLVLVCEGGKRAQIVAEWLRGQREVTVLEGGIRTWRRAGFTTVACAPCRWSLERQVRFAAGLLALVGSVLAALVNAKWVFLPMFIGAGLTFAGLTNICGMAILLAKMPWNSHSRTGAGLQSPNGANCCT